MDLKEEANRFMELQGVKNALNPSPQAKPAEPLFDDEKLMTDEEIRITMGFSKTDFQRLLEQEKKEGNRNLFKIIVRTREDRCVPLFNQVKDYSMLNGKSIWELFKAGRDAYLNDPFVSNELKMLLFATENADKLYHTLENLDMLNLAVADFMVRYAPETTALQQIYDLEKKNAELQAKLEQQKITVEDVTDELVFEKLKASDDQSFLNACAAFVRPKIAKVPSAQNPPNPPQTG